MNPYDAIAALAERELALVRAGRLEELAPVHAERDALIAGLPGAPAPRYARAALLRAARAQAEVVAALAAARESTGRELAHLRRGRGAVRAYGQVGAPAAAVAADRRA
jgi:hypothetical protein